MAAGRRIRSSSCRSAAGIVCAFPGIGGGLAPQRRPAITIGWGIQFSSRRSWACSLWSAWSSRPNLWGLVRGCRCRRWRATFHWRLIAQPRRKIKIRRLLDRRPLPRSWPRPAQRHSLARRSGLRSPAVLREIFAIFAAMGLGLASPYLAIAAVPSLRLHCRDRAAG